MPAKKSAGGPIRRRQIQTTNGTQIPASLLGRMQEFNKIHGEGTAVIASQIPAAKHIPFGIFTLDMALCGGLPEGYATMFYGLESSGKTLLCFKAIAGFQRKYPDQYCLFVDAEKLYDKEWARKNGVDTDRCIDVTPDTGEQAIDAIRDFMSDPNIGLVVLDSIPACVPKAVDDRSAEDKTRGALAALMGILCSKILVSWGQERKKGHRVTVIYTNQYRKTMDVKYPGVMHLPGGRQINHLPLTKIKFVGKEEAAEGDFGLDVMAVNEFSFKLEKAKLGQSIREGAFPVILAHGHESGLPIGAVDDAPTVLVYALKFGLVTGGGAAYRMSHFTDKVFRNYEAISDWLRQNPEEATKVKASIIAAQRISAGLEAFPPDGYLCGLRNARTQVPFIPVVQPAADAPNADSDVEIVEADASED